ATGMPLSGGMIAADQFEPEGLRFQELAMLTIEPARPVQGLKLHGFGYSGSGTDFQLSPASSSGNGVSVLLMHFSGGGVGSGDDLADLGPKTAEAIALTLLDTLEQNQPIDPHALENVFANWLTGVEFRVNHSTGNDDELILSIDDYSAWSSRIAGYPTVSGLFSDRHRALEAAILVQVGLAVDKASAACKSADDVTRAFFMLRLMGRVEKLGLGGAVVAAVWDKVDGCLRFDLDVESTNVEGIDGPLVSWTFYPVVHATVPIRLDRSAGTELSLKGQAVLKAMAPVRTDFTCHVPFAQNCASTISGSLEGVFSVLNSTFGIDVAMGESELPRHMEMVIGVTELDGIVQFDWDTDGSHETTGALDARIWTDAFGAAHRDEREGAAFRIRKWDVQGGAVFAQKKYENLTAPQSPPLIAVTEPLTTFVLRHTPQ
ncbi:MAG: hypothetical protein ACXWLM_10175, partial [Myxococcales bacterium]